MENIEGRLPKKIPMEFKNNSYIYRKPFHKIRKCSCGWNPGYTSALQNQ